MYPRSIPPGHLSIVFPNFEYTIQGGPYMAKPAHKAGVKMAAEINLFCTIDIPTEDFSIPDVQVFKRGLVRAINLMQQNIQLYVGCYGGVGRTGLFLAGLVKVSRAYGNQSQDTAIRYVRKYYDSHAVETQQQIKFINDLNVSRIQDWTESLYRV